MKLTHLLAWLCLTTLAFAACKKKDNDTPKLKRQLLTEGKWNMVGYAFKMNYGGDTTTGDLMTDAEACEKDDFLTFRADGAVIYDQGALQCEPGHAQNTLFGSWQLMDNDTKMKKRMDFFGGQVSDTVIADVQLLNEGALQLHYTYKEDSSFYFIEITESYKNIK